MRSHLVVVAFAAACGGGSSNTDEPIPSTPLAGSLNGTPWTAGVAIAKNSSTPGEKTIRFHENAAATCTTFLGEPYVAVVMPWVPGTQKIDLESEIAAFVFMDATVHLVLDGRVELDDAPTTIGAKPLIRVRVAFEDDDDDLFVEGEIAAEICD